MTEDALNHLGNVLYILAELHPDDQCEAYTNALKFYNKQCPNARIEPLEGYTTRLLQKGPLGINITPEMIKAGAKACSRWLSGKEMPEPTYDSLKPELQQMYAHQALSCLIAALEEKYDTNKTA